MKRHRASWTRTLQNYIRIRGCSGCVRVAYESFAVTHSVVSLLMLAAGHTDMQRREKRMDTFRACSRSRSGYNPSYCINEQASHVRPDAAPDSDSASHPA